MVQWGIREKIMQNSVQTHRPCVKRTLSPFAEIIFAEKQVADSESTRKGGKLRNLVFEGLSPFKHCQKWQNITLHLIHY